VVDPTLANAYKACAAFAASHYENFPVASRLLPGYMRPHVAAVYAFARVGDDIADEGTDSAEARGARLRAWQARLHEAVNTRRAPVSGDSRDDLIVIALAHSIRQLELPIGLLDDLLSAFAQDTTVTRYDTWTDLFDYCRRSANPVGRLVLRIAGHRDESLDRSSDALCTALQLANFWQDFGRDWRAGRLYVPRETYDAAGASLDDLPRGRLTAAWSLALTHCFERTSDCFERGRAVCDGVRGRLRLELRLTWLGGHRILTRAARQPALLLSERPTLGAHDVPALLWQAIRWPRQAA
jgi:squalene synthase HpnC